MNSLQYLNKYFFKYKWRFLFGIIFTIISNYFGVQMPLYVKTTVDDLMGSTTISGYEDALFLSFKKNQRLRSPLSNQSARINETSQQQ